MKDEKALIKVSNKGGILNNVVEFIKSKLSKSYILTENSPEFLKQNKKLIMKTIKINPDFLDSVPDNILMEELQQPQLPVDGIIYAAFENGYVLGKKSTPILIGEDAKVAILQYIEMRKEIPNKDILLSINFSDLQFRITSVLEGIDEKLLLDENFKKQLVDLLVEKGYKIHSNSPGYLKEDGRLAEKYYIRILEGADQNRLFTESILSPELIKDKTFLYKYISLLAKNGIDTDTIVKTITQDKECKEVLKENIELFYLLFDQISPENLKEFFDNFFGKEELQKFLSTPDTLYGEKLLQLSQLYRKDNSIIDSLNGKLLGEKYQNIPLYKKQLIAKNDEFQKKLLGLNDYQYALYSKMAEGISRKTTRWNRFEYNIIENLTDGYYNELITDLYEQTKQGNKISSKDIETLTFLLSGKKASKSVFDENLSRLYDEEQRKKEEALYSNNPFNITKKIELENYSKIKELVCDTILTNPSLDDEELTSSIQKYLNKFRELPTIDRIKLALLEKYYNMDLSEASEIVEKFSRDINNIPSSNEFQSGIIEQIRAIKNIYECGDINLLLQVSNLDMLVETDLSTSTYLIEEAKEIYEQLYQQNLYMPKESEKIGTVTYQGKTIDVFNPGIDFSMIVKRITIMDQNSQEVWNSLTKEGENGRDLRYKTSTSYMTDENLLAVATASEVTLGFANGTKGYSFEEMHREDAHTRFYGGDAIYNSDPRGKYVLPSTLETDTNDAYNEIVINTLKVDENGQMTKMQPDYVIYIKDGEDLEENQKWENTKRVASEFGIPIIIIDKEKVKESERKKIVSMSDKLTSSISEDDALKFVKKVEHYIARYGKEDILQYASKEKLNGLKEYAEREEEHKKGKFEVPSVHNLTTNGNSTLGKQSEQGEDQMAEYEK